MEPAKEILAGILEKEDVEAAFKEIKIDIMEAMMTQCHQALHGIKAIIEDDSLTDFDCIEKIVCVFGEIGSGGGCGHDFG